MTYAAENDFIVKDGVLTKYQRNETSLTIPTALGIVSIGNAAFIDCINLKSVTIPDSVTSIGDSAFNGCVNLTLVKIPNGVTSIGEGAFASCMKLTSINIPKGVASISDSTFYNCYKLASIIIPDTVTYIGSSAFESCNSINLITIPESVMSISDNAFYSCYNLKIKGIKGSYAENYCKNALILLSTGSGFPTERGITFIAETFNPIKLTVLINSSNVTFTAYNINGNNYFKLRDLAQALNGTGKQFAVEWDSANKAMNLTSATAYTPIGGELFVSDTRVKQVAALSTAVVNLNGSAIKVKAYNIGGSNYFKARDLAEVINFAIGWNAPLNTISIDTSRGYKI